MNLTDKANELLKENSLFESVENGTKRRMPMKLQFFAEGGEGEGSVAGEGEGQGEGAGSGEGQGTGEGEGKETYTRSEVDSEISKAVDKALKNRDAKHQEDLQKAIDDALAEKERLSKLSEKERKEEEMTQREKKLAEKEAEIARKILRSEAVDDLQEKNLPSEFADFLLGEDAETTLENINNFKKTFDEAVNAAVKEKLRQDTPPAGTGAFKSGKTPSVAELAQKHRLIK